MQDVPRETIIEAAKGNMEAFRAMYDASSGFVYSIALRMMGAKEDAEEITQDVFMKIYKNLKHFQFRSSFKTWIYRIAANTAINFAKQKSKRVNRMAGYDDAVKFEAARDETAERIEKEENEKRVESLLSRLNPDQRACVVLRDIEGLSYEEIAEALKININTVRSRLKRAREALLGVRSRHSTHHDSCPSHRMSRPDPSKGGGKWIAKR